MKAATEYNTTHLFPALAPVLDMVLCGDFHTVSYKPFVPGPCSGPCFFQCENTMISLTKYNLELKVCGF